MALAEVQTPATLYGRATPRLAPPVPARSDLDAFRQTAADIGIALMPWQETDARYLEALAPDGRHLYQEVCTVVARQNGKTEVLVPLIVKRLRAGRRIMHTAQNRDLPREVFARVADIMSEDMTLFAQRNGRSIRPRFANGQEEITLRNGGRYKIVAPSRGGARGGTNDDVIIDEVRELDTFDFIGAAKPTMTASPDPQMIYLSNAGDDASIVLNSIRDRASEDPRLAYLEWSAGPDRASDDVDGWLEADPAIGHMPTMLEYLSGEYVSNKLAGTLTIFETEHLCRWVVTMRAALVDEVSWARCHALKVDRPRRPAFGISMDPSGTRASVVMAWRQTELTTDGRPTFALRELFDVPGEPIDTDALGEDAMAMARKMGATAVGYDDHTDRDLARHFLKKAKAIIGKDFANATEAFVRAVVANQIRWVDGDHITADLKATSRKDNDETGTYYAVKSKDDLPVTAAFAAIRAFWLASGSSPSGRLKVY